MTISRRTLMMSAAAAIIAPKLPVAAGPTPAIGQELGYAIVGQCSSNFTGPIQWYRDGAPILGETGMAYALRDEDIGHRIDFGMQLT